MLTSFTNGIQKQHMIKIKIRMKHFQYFYSLKMTHLINWTFSRIQSFQLSFHQEKFTAVGWNLYSGQKWEWGKCLFQFWDSNSSLIFSRGYCHHFLFHAKLIFGFFSYFEIKIAGHRFITSLTLTKSKSYHKLEIRRTMRAEYVHYYLYLFFEFKMKLHWSEKSLSKLIYLDQNKPDQKNLVHSISRKLINS